MSLTLTYKNELGTLTMNGGGNDSSLRITSVEGLGPVTREYNTAIYSGYDGQETLGSRAEARCITIALEVMGKNITQEVRNALFVLSQAGTLYIKNENLYRLIHCSQVHIPDDITRVLRSRIATFLVQFVCDNPYFEDGAYTVVPLYKRTKLLSTPFTLPTMFGEIVIGGEVEINSETLVEPVITMHYPKALDGIEGVTLTNESTGKSLRIDYAPKADDTVTIDIKNRKITSTVSGNLINYLTDDSFLGDFVLVRGTNVISVDLGDVTSDFVIECKYNNLYNEAVLL